MELPIGNVYQQTPRDERSTQWGPFNFNEFISASATSITIGGIATNTAPWSVPAGYVAHIRSFALTGNPGAGQKINSAHVTVRNEADNELLNPWNFNTGLAANINLGITVATDILLISPAHVIDMRMEFDAGVGANTARFSVQAILMPKGNIALF